MLPICYFPRQDWVEGGGGGVVIFFFIKERGGGCQKIICDVGGSEKLAPLRNNLQRSLTSEGSERVRFLIVLTYNVLFVLLLYHSVLAGKHFFPSVNCREYFMPYANSVKLID